MIRVTQDVRNGRNFCRLFGRHGAGAVAELKNRRGLVADAGRSVKSEIGFGFGVGRLVSVVVVLWSGNGDSHGSEVRKIEEEKLKGRRLCVIWFLGNGKGAFGGDDCWLFIFACECVHGGGECMALD